MRIIEAINVSKILVLFISARRCGCLLFTRRSRNSAPVMQAEQPQLLVFSAGLMQDRFAAL
jgi:hypothetical protein